MLPTNVAAELLTACLCNMCLMHLSAQATLQPMLLVLLWRTCVLVDY